MRLAVVMPSFPFRALQIRQPIGRISLAHHLKEPFSSDVDDQPWFCCTEAIQLHFALFASIFVRNNAQLLSTTMSAAP